MHVIACAFKQGVAFVGKKFLQGIAHPVVGPPFRYRGCTGRRRSDKAVIMKEADVWPWYFLYKKYFV